MESKNYYIAEFIRHLKVYSKKREIQLYSQKVLIHEVIGYYNFFQANCENCDCSKSMARTKKCQRDIINNSVRNKAEYKKRVPLRTSKIMLITLKIT